MRTLEGRKLKRDLKREFAINYLGGVCNKCGSSEKLEFDHIDRSTVKYRIAVMYEWSNAKIMEELNKCQLLCRKCHVEKTTSEDGKVRVTHGNSCMYSVYGCRCGECKKAWANRMREYRRRKKQ